MRGSNDAKFLCVTYDMGRTGSSGLTRWQIASVVVAAAMTLLVAGCGGSDTARSAAEEELASDEVVVVDDAEAGYGSADADNGADAAADASAEPSAEEAGPANLAEAITAPLTRGVKICIDNYSSSQIYAEFSVASVADGPTYLGKGDYVCGHGNTTVDSDVTAKLGPSNRVQPYFIQGDNPWIGAPYFTLYTPVTKIKADLKLGDLCFSNSGFSEGETREWDDGIVKINVLRKNDSPNFKEFRMRIYDSERPDPGPYDNGNRCSAGSYP